MRPFFVVLSAFFILIALSGCAKPLMSDLETFVATIKKKPSPPLKELPQFPTEENYQYQAIKNKKPDPFISFEQEVVIKDEDIASDEELPEDCPRPDRYRAKQQLELFPLDALIMVGSLAQGGKIWGLVLDPDGNVHRVEENNYAGKRYGRIISIDENTIQLHELHQDERGCYEEVPAKIVLTVVD